MPADAPQKVLAATLPSSLDSYQGYIQEVLTALEALNWPAKPDLFAVHLALEESISNAVRHGNQHDDSKHVHVECRLDNNMFWAQVCDEGPGYCPDEIPDCRDETRREVPGGRGLALIRAYMSEVAHNKAGNCLVFSRRIGEQPTVGSSEEKATEGESQQ